MVVKFKAVNSNRTTSRPRKQKATSKGLSKIIALYLNKLDEADKAAEPEKNAGLTAAKTGMAAKASEELKRKSSRPLCSTTQ